MKPDYNTMTKAELRAYVIANRSDREAFYQLVDRLKADSQNQVIHPFPKSLEDVAKVKTIIQEQIRKLDNNE